MVSAVEYEWRTSNPLLLPWTHGRRRRYSRDTPPTPGERMAPGIKWSPENLKVGQFRGKAATMFVSLSPSLSPAARLLGTRVAPKLSLLINSYNANKGHHLLASLQVKSLTAVCCRSRSTEAAPCSRHGRREPQHAEHGAARPKFSPRE